MEFYVIPIVALIFLSMQLIIVSSTNDPKQEVYWRSKFPGKPMPIILENLLVSPTDAVDHMKATLAYLVNMSKAIETKQKEKYDLPRQVIYGQNNESTYGKVHKDVFFLEGKLHRGYKVDSKELTIEVNKAAFLSRSMADLIPFSTEYFAQILTYFSIRLESPESHILREQIEICELPAIEGEKKYCATSFEAFIDAGVSLLGEQIQLLSPKLDKIIPNPNFIIDGVKLKAKSDVVCHKLNYAYAVYLCHCIQQTHIYEVPLIGEDGTKATALAVCHQNTSAWNPKHLAFHVLKVKPGTVPICHFLEKGTLVWVPST